MIPILLNVLLLLSQGIPALPGQSGSIAGTLKTESGAPAVGVRVAAMAKPENPLDIAGASSLAGIAETDDTGRFRIENISPGTYYVTAGRVDGPTYYPGTLDISSGREIVVVAGANVSAIDFVMKDVTVRPLVSALGLGGAITIPVEVRTEDGKKFPVLSEGKPATLTLKSSSSSMLVQLAPIAGFSIGVMGDYRVRVENLPDDYAVRSMTYGAVDLTTDSLKVLSRSMNAAAPVSFSIIGGAGTPVPQLQALIQQTQILVSTSLTTATPSASVTVILAAVSKSSASANGVRITGRSNSPAPRNVYLSGTPGIVYSDGSFEFRGVLPGRYSVATIASNGKLLGASLVIGNEDVVDVDLAEVSALPDSFREPAPPSPVTGHLPGPVALAAVHGRVLEKATQQPIPEGTVQLLGYRPVTIPIDSDGRFEMPRLLPGRYEVELQIFGHEHTHEVIVVGDEDTQIVMNSLRLY